VSKRVQTQHPGRVSTKKVIAICGRRNFLVTLDMGAFVTILPKEVVNQENMRGVVIDACCANETLMPLEEARVKLSVEDMELTCRVGVALSRFIGGTELLSFDLDNEEE